MPKILIKPLSVNQAWMGRKFKTKFYKDYEIELSSKLPKLKIDKTKKLTLDLIVGYSNSNSDIDNFLKPFIDILQKKYLFNDRNIYKLNIVKEIVKKGDEFIEFEINEIE
jgi:Holliday junction resolvase RusA-like endonuclease